MLGSKAWMTLLLFLSPRLRMASELHWNAVDPSPESFGYPHYCPFDIYCDKESKNITDVEDAECCQDCSCDTFCSPSGICCPQMDRYILETHFNQSNNSINLFSNQSEYQGFLPDRFYPCVLIDDLLNKARGLHYQFTQTTALRVITDCPSINRSLEYPKCEEPETLEDFRMVVCEKGMVYKNEHCAKCHGERHTNAWVLQPNCDWLRERKHFESFVELNAYILRFCKLESYPPMNNISNLAQCFSSVAPPSRVCPEVPPEMLMGKSPSIRPFTAILYDDTEEPAKKDKCQSYEWWDPYSANCRRVFCPPLMIPRHIRCVDMFISYQGFVLNVLFKAVNWNDSFDLTDAHSLLVGLQDLYFVECIICMAEFELSRNNQGLEGTYIRIGFTTNESCTMNVILDKVRRMSHTIIDIKIDRISLKLVLQLEEVYRQDWLFSSSMRQTCYDGISVTKELLRQCPRIEVPDHISELKVENIFIQFMPNEYDGEDKKVICVKDYFDLMKAQAETSGQGITCSTTVLILSFIVACLK